MILDNGVRGTAFRKVVADQAPVTATVFGFKYIGFVITAFVVVDHGIGHIGIMEGGDKVLDQRHVRYILEGVHHAPVVAAIRADMDQAVIGAGVNQTFDQRAFIHCNQRAISRGRDILGNGINTPDPVHYFKFVAIDITAQVTGNSHPAFAAVVGTEQAF